jgi:hypothetical protein
VIAQIRQLKGSLVEVETVSDAAKLATLPGTAQTLKCQLTDQEAHDLVTASSVANQAISQEIARLKIQDVTSGAQVRSVSDPIPMPLERLVFTLVYRRIQFLVSHNKSYNITRSFSELSRSL